MNTKTFVGAFAAITLSASAFAAPFSNSVEYRGYQACVAAAEKDSQGLITERDYYIDRQGGDAQYFINATRWEDGERNNVRITCKTTNRGVSLVDASIADGRYVTPDASVRVEVAGK